MAPLNLQNFDRIFRTHKKKVLHQEDNLIEYKKEFDWTDKGCKLKCIKELAALSNAGGGYLIYGVNDKGEIVGEDRTEDLANIHDFFGRYFSPSIQFSASTYYHNEIPLFVIYAPAYSSIPTVCIKDSDEFKAGHLLWRYTSKSQPIGGRELISLLQELKRSDEASEKLLAEQRQNRKQDIMPRFEFNFTCKWKENGFHSEFTNKGADSFLKDVVLYKHMKADIANLLTTEYPLPKNECGLIEGTYKETQPPFKQRVFAFRIYFTDIDQNWYFNDFEGVGGAMQNPFPLPIETSEAEYQHFKRSQT